MSTRIACKGAQLKYAATATPTNIIPGLRSVALTIGDRELINATCHDSTATKEYIAALLRDTAGIECTIAYDPAATAHEAIRAAQAAGTLHYLTIVLPDTGAAEWALSGYWLSFGMPTLNPETGLMESTLKFKASGAETFTQ